MNLSDLSFTHVSSQYSLPFQELPKRCDGLLTGTTPAALGEALTHSQVGVVGGAVQAMRCRWDGDRSQGLTV